MGNDPSSDQQSKQKQLPALRWQLGVAEQFLSWRTTRGAGLKRMISFAEAIARTLRQDGQQFAESGELASKLLAVLASCDQLTFHDRVDALAYAGLHLLDRYGRVNQVLEYLLRIGRLPLRRGGVQVLEVGAGPAPALYSTRDFYADLLRWPELGDVQIGPLAAFHALDRGSAWDPFLHHLSENLLRNDRSAWEEGQVAFGRSHDDFSGFSVIRHYHDSIASSAERIAQEFNHADEPISDATARRLAYEEGVTTPSAYDMVFLCNFLTQLEMAERFEVELRNLARSLTSGGLLIVLGGTGHDYPTLHSKVKAIAKAAHLRDVSPQDTFRANADPRYLSLIASHVRENIKWVRTNCPPVIWAGVAKTLPKDLLDEEVIFRLPSFRALVFVNQSPSLREKKRRQRNQRDSKKTVQRVENLPTIRTT